MTLPPIHSEQVYALVVGIEQYQAGSDYDLNGPAKDALQFATWLLDRGVQPDHIRLFLSPLEQNKSVNEIAVAKGLKPEPATRGQIDSTIRSEFTSENGRGDLLYVFWGGHGILTKTDDTTRRLLFADTDRKNNWNLNVTSLVDALRTAAYKFGFPRQVFVIDACANPDYQGLWQTIQAEAAEIKFAASGDSAVHTQCVLFASPEYGVAINDSELGTGRFSQAVLNELKGQPLLPEVPEIEALFKRVQDVFRLKQRSQPAYWLRFGNDEKTIPAVKGDASRGQENLPRVNPVFVGREEALEALHLQLKADAPMAIASIQGMGGIGKTELALQYARKHKEAGDYPGGVCWLRGREDVGLQIVGFARSRLKLAIPTDEELLEQVRICWRDWQKDDALIVVDDVQSYKEIEGFLPPQGRQFRVLLTTRQYLTGSMKRYEIKELSEANSLELLRRLVQDDRIEQDLDGSKRLCQWLGYLPLALELVGRYLAANQALLIQELWDLLQEEKLAAEALIEHEEDMTKQLGVAAVFELSWKELDLKAQQIAALLSLFALAEIPWSLVEACLPGADPKELKALRNKRLVNLSLLSFERGEMFLLHQLLREFFAVKRSLMPEDEDMKRSFCRVMSEIALQMPSQMPRDWTLVSISQFSSTIPHLKEAAKPLQSWLTDGDVIMPATRIAQFYEAQFAFGEAEEWYLHGRSISTQRLGENHSHVALSLDNLARLYHSQGRYEQAESLYIQALELHRSLLGKNHSNVATSLSNLAGLYRSQGRYEQAESLYIQALELDRSLLGENHPNVATSLNNLAGLYRSQGRYEQAEPLFIQALQLYQTLLGENHPNVATSLNNLALLYHSQGRYEQAEPLYIQALEIRRSLLGENHPDVASSLNNLAVLYYYQGRITEAEPILVQALEQRQQLLGNQHQDTIGTRQSLEYVRQRMG